MEAFVKSKKPTSDLERNLVFIYYLKKTANVANVTADHVFSCYKQVKLPVPALGQSLKNTSFKKGWIDTSSMSDMKTTIAGENHIEHKLPAGGTKADQ